MIALVHLEVPKTLQYSLFLGFFASLAVQLPMLPYQIWLPQAHIETANVGSVLLAGKFEGYGFIWFSRSLFPIASEGFFPVMIVLSIVAVVYGALTTCRQYGIKRLTAYFWVSHTSLLTLSLFTHSLEGDIAFVVMMIAHGLIISGLCLTSFNLYSKFYSSMIYLRRKLLGTSKRLLCVCSCSPLLLLFWVLGNIFFPGTVNLFSECLSLLFATKYSILADLGFCIGVFLGTVYYLIICNRVYLYYVRDLTTLEFRSFIPLLLSVVFLGAVSNFILVPLLQTMTFQVSL